jgi:hypothetical protein
MPAVKPKFLTTEGYLREDGPVSITGDGTSVFTKSFLKAALRSYGEDQVLQSVVAGLRRDQVEAIGARYAKLEYQSDPSGKSGRAYPGDKALALAAVAVLEGRSRELTRKHRRPRTDPPVRDR